MFALKLMLHNLDVCYICSEFVLPALNLILLSEMHCEVLILICGLWL